MKKSRNIPLSLDPANWEEFQKLAHKMMDDMMEHFQALPEKPAWQGVPDKVKENLSEPLPMGGIGENATYEQFRENILPFPTGNQHPAFFGWVMGNGTPLAMLADMLASGLNPHMAGFHQAPRLVEEQVVKWLIEMMGFAESASGLLVSGSSMANLMGLVVARHSKAGFDVRKKGMVGAPQRLIVYASSQTHQCAKKAVEILGLGHENLRIVAIDEGYRLCPKALAGEIAKDRKAGHKPICVIATAGTTNMGVCDPLEEIGVLCEKEDIWFHIDGAFGGFAWLSPKHRSFVKGLQRASSFCFDLHKWMYLPFEVACLIVRSEEAHIESFAMTSSYLASSDAERGVAAGGIPFAQKGIELTRSFRALKVWMNLKAYGVSHFAKLIEQNIEQTQYLVGLIEKHPKLQVMGVAPLNVACFRYYDEGLSEQELNTLNHEILLRSQEGGKFVLSSTEIGGGFALRFCNTNHRTTLSYMDSIIAEIPRLAEEILA